MSIVGHMMTQILCTADPNKVSEKALQSLVEATAMQLGLLCYHTHDSRRSAAGFPDCTIVGKRGIVFAELKREKGKPTPAQEKWLWELGRHNGGPVWVCLWKPSDWPEIKRTLEAIA